MRTIEVGLRVSNPDDADCACQECHRPMKLLGPGVFEAAGDHVWLCGPCTILDVYRAFSPLYLNPKVAREARRLRLWDARLDGPTEYPDEIKLALLAPTRN